MAQIATTHDKKSAEQPRTGADRVADVARDAGDQGRKLANEVAETTASMVERTAANTMAAAAQMARAIPRLAATSGPGNDLVGFWGELRQGAAGRQSRRFQQACGGAQLAGADERPEQLHLGQHRPDGRGRIPLPPADW